MASLKNLVAAVFRIEHPATPETISQLLGLLQEWLTDRPDLRRMFAQWIRATLMRKTEYRIVLPELDDLQGMKVMLVDRLEEWAHGYRAEGVQQGVQQGEALSLLRLLSKRFGVVSPEISARINAASPTEIEQWLDRIFDAERIGDIFSGTTKH